MDSAGRFSLAAVPGAVFGFPTYICGAEEWPSPCFMLHTYSRTGTLVTIATGLFLYHSITLFSAFVCLFECVASQKSNNV